MLSPSFPVRLKPTYTEGRGLDERLKPAAQADTAATEPCTVEEELGTRTGGPRVMAVTLAQRSKRLKVVWSCLSDAGYSSA